MPKLDLTYPTVLQLFGPYVMKGRTESRALLAWFLENYYHFEATEVDDSICDARYDKGVDGLYVNDQLSQVDIFQVQLVQAASKTLGDVALKEFIGSLSQFCSGDSIRQLEKTTVNDELKGLLCDLQVASKVDSGYEVRGIFITNAKRDKNASDLLAISHNIVLYDHLELERLYLPIDKSEPIATEISFDVASVPTLLYLMGAGLEMVIAPLAAQDLIKMEGIASQELFSWNVRQWLKRTNVNRDIEKSIKEKSEHIYFPAFHNGLTVLCENLEASKERIVVSGYAVVNGCQSLTGLYENRSSITPELRILTKFIKVSPQSELAKKITDHTNNQNSITGRDRQSNNPIQTRLQSDIHRKYPNVFYRVKRGEQAGGKLTVIENELAARILLAFDLRRPEACHQHYRLFEDLHPNIFARPEVNADRVVALHDIDEVILEKRSLMAHSLFAYYGLTRFLFHNLLREVLEQDSEGRRFYVDPTVFISEPNGRECLKRAAGAVITVLMRLVDGELKRREYTVPPQPFDYKRQLKSAGAVNELRSMIIPQYNIAVDAGYAPTFSGEWHNPTQKDRRRA